MKNKAAIVSGLLAAVLGLSLAVVGTSVAEQQANPNVCAGLTSGKIDTVGDPESVTITASPGYLITGYCVKGGSLENLGENGGDGPKYFAVTPPAASVTFDYVNIKGKKKAISHYSYTQVPIETTTTTTTTTTTSQETTTTTVPTTTTSTTTQQTTPSTTTVTSPGETTVVVQPERVVALQEYELAETGSNSMPYILSGALIVLVGGLMILMGLRRRKVSEVSVSD